MCEAERAAGAAERCWKERSGRVRLVCVLRDGVPKEQKTCGNRSQLLLRLKWSEVKRRDSCVGLFLYISNGDWERKCHPTPPNNSFLLGACEGKGKSREFVSSFGFPLHREGWAARAVRVLMASDKPRCSPALQAPPGASWKFLSKWK